MSPAVPARKGMGEDLRLDRSDRKSCPGAEGGGAMCSTRERGDVGLCRRRP
jgi:hypothetical protein